MTKDDLLDIRAVLDKVSYWAHKKSDLFQIIDAKKKVEDLLNEDQLSLNLEKAVEADVNIYRDLSTGKSWAEFVVEMPAKNLGDKARIIILPKEA